MKSTIIVLAILLNCCITNAQTMCVGFRAGIGRSFERNSYRSKSNLYSYDKEFFIRINTKKRLSFEGGILQYSTTYKLNEPDWLYYEAPTYLSKGGTAREKHLLYKLSIMYNVLPKASWLVNWQYTIGITVNAGSIYYDEYIAGEHWETKEVRIRNNKSRFTTANYGLASTILYKLGKKIHLVSTTTITTIPINYEYTPLKETLRLNTTIGASLALL